MNGEGSVRVSLQAEFGTVANMPLYIKCWTILYVIATGCKSICMEFLVPIFKQIARERGRIMPVIAVSNPRLPYFPRITL